MRDILRAGLKIDEFSAKIVGHGPRVKGINTQIGPCACESSSSSMRGIMAKALKEFSRRNGEFSFLLSPPLFQTAQTFAVDSQSSRAQTNTRYLASAKEKDKNQVVMQKQKNPINDW